MSGCAAQLFTGISPAAFACIQGKAADQGVTISGNQGSASKDGVTIAWDYDPIAQTLTIQCTAAPFFLSCGTINSTIHSYVDDCS